ncbi:hypothetical protein NPIL_281871 [Nephila pilipes]|uniref:Uncharacterized protein n=1 Tax=Nephila pilipes TaxID=299642 RepID=A0A8X6Q800_NEPPI|nr:hypothetical protein NPIL_281871 [Nephila pilipes]
MRDVEQHRLLPLIWRIFSVIGTRAHDLTDWRDIDAMTTPLPLPQHGEVAVELGCRSRYHKSITRNRTEYGAIEVVCCLMTWLTSVFI